MMKAIKYIITVMLISLIFTGCDTKDKIDQTAKKVEQMERNQAKMQKQISYYKNKEKEATSYINYIIIFVFALIGLYILKIIISKSTKLIKRG